MQQSALHSLFFFVFRGIDRLHILGIESAPIHSRRSRRGRRIEILNLLGHIIQRFQINRKIDRRIQIAARVRRNEIRYEILVFSLFLLSFPYSATNSS